MSKKKQYYAGLSICFLSLIFFNVALYLKHGTGYLWINQLYIGIPVCSLLAGYTAYGSVKYYDTQKAIFLPPGLAEDVRAKREKEWREHQYLLLSKLMRTLGTLFGMVTPLYFLAYQEHVKELHATPFKIACFAILTVVCLTISYLLKKKYIRLKNGHT